VWRDRLGHALAAAGGPGITAVLLGGSHAVGDAVWLTLDGRTVTLSDVDAWLVAEDETARRAAELRLRDGLPALARSLAAEGLEAPIDASVFTRARLTRMPARPATLELRRRGRVVWGDPSVIESVPDPDPSAIPAEEALLLVENRAFELLMAWPGLRDPAPLTRARARHGVLKSALDLIPALALASGELPLGARPRVEWAHAHPGDAALARLRATGVDALWSAALAWRAGETGSLSPAELANEWRTAARAWVEAWRTVGSRTLPDAPEDGHARALALAGRARLRRRLRQSLTARGTGSPLTRLRLGLIGTPHHRLDASATVMLVAAAEGGDGPPALGTRALRALARLGSLPRPSGWDEACRTLVRLWDTHVLDGQRTAGWSS
jgi:predicted nucleotidyltransferase